MLLVLSLASKLKLGPFKSNVNTAGGETSWVNITLNAKESAILVTTQKFELVVRLEGKGLYRLTNISLVVGLTCILLATNSILSPKFK